jgi:hypothetical protein
MRLTWKDAVSTLFVAAVAAVYLAFRDGTTAWLISSARGTTTAVLALGVAGGCALGRTNELYLRPQPASTRVFRAVDNALGLVALVAAVVGLISGATLAVSVLVVATLALWLTATIRHAFARAGQPAGMPMRGAGSHEVITPVRAGYR